MEIRTIGKSLPGVIARLRIEPFLFMKLPDVSGVFDCRADQ